MRTGGGYARVVDRHEAARGFTLLEMALVMLLVALSLSVASNAFNSYQTKAAARQAAKVFARDLAFARSNAARAREVVVVRFDEAAKNYVIEMASGVEVLRRSFVSGENTPVDSIDLQFTGDSVTFNRRGIADLSGGGGSLGTARFSAGASRFEVQFNSMGASRVGEGT